MRALRLSFVMLVAGVSLLLCSDSVWAQRRVPYYETRPPISPYFYLYRGSVGGVPAYHAWVLPQQRYQEFVQREQLERQRLGAVERQVLVRPQTGIGQPAMVGGYMNYLHFYQFGAPGSGVGVTSAPAYSPARDYTPAPVYTPRAGAGMLGR